MLDAAPAGRSGLGVVRSGDGSDLDLLVGDVAYATKEGVEVGDGAGGCGGWCGRASSFCASSCGPAYCVP